MTIDRVGICNLALAKIGHEEFINDPDENTRAARFFNKLYEPIRDSLLRQYLWKFARKRAILAPLVTGPAFDGGNYFQLPSDCLRVVGTSRDKAQGYMRWFVEGDKIVADTDSLEIVYIARITSENIFDATFVEAFASKLAYDISIPLTQSASLKEAMNDEFRRNIIMAAHTGATEQDSMKFISEAFIRVHN